MGFMNINIFINKVEFGIYKIINEKTKYILEDEIIIPKSFSIGERLSYIRTMVSIVVKEYGVSIHVCRRRYRSRDNRCCKSRRYN